MNKVKKLLSILMVVAMLISMGSIAFAEQTGTIANNAPGGMAQVYATASDSGEALTPMIAGMPVTVYEKQGDWYQVYASDGPGQRGFIKADLILGVDFSNAGGNENQGGNNTNTGGNDQNNNNTNTGGNDQNNNNTNTGGNDQNNTNTGGNNTNTGGNNTNSNNATSTYAKVKTSSNAVKAILRESASDSSTNLGEYTNEYMVKVLSKGEVWTYVDAGGNKVGYMKTAELDFGGSTPTTAPTTAPTTDPNAKYAYVNQANSNERLNLRREPSDNGEIIGQYYNDTKVQVLSRGTTWTNVKIVSDGKTGYMMTKYLRFEGDPTPTPTATATPTAVPGAKYAYVNQANNSERLNLRREPSDNGEIIGQYYNETKVQVLSRGTTWTQVKVVGDSKEGYMMTRYLRFEGEVTPPPTSSPDPVNLYAKVNNPNPREWLNLRAQPNSYSRILGQYFNGTVVRVTQYAHDWSKVIVDNKEGYMMTRYLSFGDEPTPTPTPTQGTVRYAVVNNPNPRDRLNLRALPSTSSTSLARFYNGTTVKVLKYESTWCHVEVSGMIGYMMTYYLAFTDMPCPIVTPPPGNVTYATVNNPVPTQRLNLRAAPNKSSASLGQYYNGKVVKVLSHGAEWSRVEVDGKVGYMMTYYLSFSGGGGGGGPVNPTRGVVTNPVASQRLNLRAYPNITSCSLGQYYNGTVVKILEYDKDWCRVQVDGLIGYMMTRYLRVS